jgi:streptogramin lyase
LATRTRHGGDRSGDGHVEAVLRGIDPATGDVVTIEVGAGPDGIAVDDDGIVWFTAHAP